jgi:hypothetical protein
MFLGFATCAPKTAVCTATPIAIAVRAPARMIVPAPGATGLPTSGFTVQVQGGLDGESLHLTDPAGAVLQGGPFTAMTPQPAATPPGGPDHQAAVPQLVAHTTYTAFLDGVAPPQPACPPTNIPFGGPYTVNLGTFTTQ